MLRNLLLFSIILCFSSCVSKKKHKAAIGLLNTTHQAQVSQLDHTIDSTNIINRNLELKVAERIGENNILLMLRDELHGEIVTLEANIENLSSTASSAQKNLSSDLAKKDQNIKQLKGYLAEVESTILTHETTIKTITGDLNYIAQDYSDDIEVNLGFDYATISLLESFLFKRESTTRMEDKGLTVLEKFSEIFQKYPSVKVQVIGHTSTDAPRDRKRYTDNWNFSALQAASVVRVLIDDFDVSSNQLTVAAKADSAPRDSNASTEGKKRNQRIELYIQMDAGDLAKKIRNALASFQLASP